MPLDDPDETECAIPRYYRDHTSGASFHAVMDIMGLRRANRS